MASNPTAIALQNAKKALESANKFTRSATGGKPSAFAPPAAPSLSKPQTDYSRVREARKAPEFMGVRADQAPELNASLKAREDAMKELGKQ